MCIRDRYYHNKPRIPELDEKSTFFLKLLRDADKIDIWRVMSEYYEGKLKNEEMGLGYLKTGKISDKVYKDVINGNLVRFTDVRTIDDFKLFHISWIYDLNFKKSYKILEEKQYIDKIFNTLPDNKKIKILRKKIKEYLKHSAKI